MDVHWFYYVSLNIPLMHGYGTYETQFSLEDNIKMGLNETA